jgi:hypothetical protein
MFETASRTATLVITNCTKIAGLVIGIKAATGADPQKEALTMAFAAFMMAGAQASERVFMAFLERFFGVPKAPGENK